MEKWERLCFMGPTQDEWPGRWARGIISYLEEAEVKEMRQWRVNAAWDNYQERALTKGEQPAGRWETSDG